MGKLPYFQFYPGDWSKDPQLRMASPSSRGIWIDCICAMWEAEERGILIGTAEQLRRVGNCSVEEFDLFLREARDLHFATVVELPMNEYSDSELEYFDDSESDWSEESCPAKFLGCVDGRCGCSASNAGA